MLNRQAELPTDVYWAAVPKEQLPDALAAQAALFWSRLQSTGLIDVWRRSHRTWYGVDGQGGWGDSVAVTYGGDSEEFAMARVNHYRSIGQALTAMGTGMRPAFEARSTNVDSKSLREAPLAVGVVDYDYRRHDLETSVTRQTEAAVRYGEGWIHLRWDERGGRKHTTRTRPVYDEGGAPKVEMVEQSFEEVDPVTGELTQYTESVEQPVTEEWPEHEGDISPMLLLPHEVIRDLTRTDHRWMAVPHRVSAWELAAQYPERRKEILDMRGGPQWPRSLWGATGWDPVEKGCEDLCQWYLYHPPTDALPEGLFAKVVGNLVLAHEPFPFEEIPVYEQAPQRHDGGQGYSPMWDLLCLQEVYDAVFSSIVSQADASAGGNVTAPKGADVSVEQLSRAFTLIEYEYTPGAPAGGAPQPLTLWSISAEHTNLLQLIQRLEETLSGINSVIRGDPDASLKSGAALALVSSLSSHFTSSVQRENTRGHERVGTGILRLYKRFATTKRVAEIAGRANRTALKEWSSKDLSRVDRVTIEIGNPLMRQRAGIQQVAETLLQAELFENRDEYLIFLNTGRLEPAYDEGANRQLQIEDENEALVDGRPIKVLWGDDHPLHIQRHLAVLFDPESRFDDALVARVAAHVDEHKTLWMGMDPAIAAALGIQPPPMPMLPPGAAPPGAPGEPPPPGGAAPAEPPPDGRAVPGGLPGNEGGGDMPFMPTNPLTGQRAPATPNS